MVGHSVMLDDMTLTTYSPYIASFRIVRPEAKLPMAATPQSSCFDIMAHLDEGTIIPKFSADNAQGQQTVQNGRVRIFPGCRYMIPTGWAVACEKNYSMRMYSRSGLSLKQGLVLVNGVGVIDADYRQEVFALIMNISRCSMDLRHGDRMCQGEFVKRDVLSDQFYTTFNGTDAEWFNTDRTGGFGSTGV